MLKEAKLSIAFLKFIQNWQRKNILSHTVPNSTDPICVRSVNIPSNSEYVDSLYYDDFQKVKSDIYIDLSYKDFYHLGTMNYVYDGNRLNYIEVIYTDGWGERMDFEYNENNLIIKETYSYDYGDGEYMPEENGELEVAYVYEYSYDPISDAVEGNTLSFNIYPNPVNDIINIEGENIDFVELYDIFGRKLYSTNSADNVKIDMSDFANGIYIANIFSDGKK